ncbi:unnamed protein product [Prorocentrum cordatum]|uniref:RNA helicase n=1 Tax=Prorocentrum cordatum TaxID=2364126 RepID=A0ABN9XJ38_9DINO|nr:unnamed protein product [Polarella glacialis]
MWVVLLDPAQVAVAVPISEWAGQLRDIAAAFPRKIVAATSKAQRFAASLREALSQRGVQVPSVADFKAKSWWAQRLTDCEANVLAITSAVAQSAGDYNPEDVSMTWDLQNSLSWPRKKDASNAGAMDCMMRRHIHWNTKVGRPLSGLEQLIIQGFPANIRISEFPSGPARPVGIHDEASLPKAEVDSALEGLSDSDLRSLSGDTQSVPVLAAILIMAMSNSRIKDRGVVAMADTDVLQSPLEVEWVGPKRFARSSPADDVFKWAGLPQQKRARLQRPA